MGWLKKNIKKLHAITKKIDPIGHYAMEFAHKSSTTLVNETAHALGKIGDAVGIGSKWADKLEELSGKDKDDFSRWLNNSIVGAAVVFGGMAAYSAVAGGGAAGAAGGATGVGGAGGAAGGAVGAGEVAAGVGGAAGGVGGAAGGAGGAAAGAGGAAGTTSTLGTIGNVLKGAGAVNSIVGALGGGQQPEQPQYEEYSGDITSYDTDGTYQEAGGATVKAETDGSITVTEADGSTKTFPPGTKVDETSGKVFNAIGTLIDTFTPAISALTRPYLDNLISGGLLKKATEMVEGGGKAIGGINVPDLTKLIPELQLRVQQGVMTPAQAEAVLQEASQMAGVTSDQASLMGARAKLNQLDEISKNQGMTEADRAQFAATMNQASARQAQNRAAQIQQLQMQGNAGTGAELATRLSGVQGDANANFAAGADVAKSAQQRALDAMKYGLEGNVQLNQQLFNQDKSKAEAQDMVNRFNAEARNAMNKANMANQQEANMTNFKTAQDVNAANTDITNQQRLLGLSTANQTFQNELAKQKAAADAQISAGTVLANAATGQITRSQQAAANSAPTASGGTGTTAGGQSAGGPSTAQQIKQGASTAKAIEDLYGSGKQLWNWGSGLWDSWTSDENNKTDKKPLSDDEVDQMMAGMTGYKYRYKGPNTNPIQTGVMAQDMETGMPNSVVNTPAGKMVQKPEALSSALAILANQHARIRKLEGKNYGRN